MRANETINHKPLSRASRLQNFVPVFAPAVTVVPPSLELTGPETGGTLQLAIPADYPRLRTILRDRGMSFKPIFGQRDVAEILGKSDKTVRAWTRMGKLPCCWWPSGDPYYTPKNLEDFLVRCERGGKETK